MLHSRSDPPVYVMAIDLGTGSTRAVVFDLAGHQVASAHREWSHLPRPGVPGSQEFDTARNWALIVECVQEVLARPEVTPERIAAISTTSMREGMVLFDDDGVEIWACPNVDARAGAEAGELVRSDRAREIYDRAGDWVSITAPARLMWIRNHAPDVFERTARLGMLADWALYRLSGRLVTDPSVGSSSGMFDLARREWSPDIAEWLGLPSSIFPEVVDSGTEIGGVSPEAAELTGLVAGTPVVVGGADTQMALVGIGSHDPNSVTVIGGSFWQTTSLEDRPVIDPEARLRTLCHAVPDRWMIEGIGFYCGIAMRWFRDAFCEPETAEATTRGVDPYVVMEERASSVSPGSGGVVAIFSNAMDAKRWVQASPGFLQLALDPPEPSTRAHCIRALEEATAYVTRRHIEIIEEVVGREMSRILFTGGAAQGFLWPQIVSDVTGLPVDVPVVKESTALGAAICAGTATGAFTDTEAAAFGRVERTFEPDPATHRTYTTYYQHWRRVYQELLSLSQRGLLRPMWWPAGVDAPPDPLAQVDR
jgi:autoinducer 2 (AI-2) kinase